MGSVHKDLFDYKRFCCYVCCFFIKVFNIKRYFLENVLDLFLITLDLNIQKKVDKVKRKWPLLLRCRHIGAKKWNIIHTDSSFWSFSKCFALNQYIILKVKTVMNSIKVLNCTFSRIFLAYCENLWLHII